MEKWVIYRVSYKGSVRPALLVWQIYSVVFDVKKLVQVIWPVRHVFKLKLILTMISLCLIG